ncbi:MAG: DNA-processing protein DprA [Myxococcota bacterium]
MDPSDDRPAQRSALRAWLRLQYALGLRPELAVELLEQHGDPVAALRAGPAVEPPSEAQLDACQAALRRCQAIALPLLSSLYPPRLRRMVDAAPLLFVQGSAQVLWEPAVSVVGARAPSAYGLAVARQLAGDLARAGLVVISGLARGIDAAAHQGALEAGGRTVAVQACGPDRVYPPEHRALAERIRKFGVMLTEFPPGTPPRAPFFPLRNRLIAGLARAVVVVEARSRSGSLITARHGLELGVDVLAVPGRIDASTSAGPNRLIREGSRPVLDVNDVLEEIGWEPRAEPEKSSGPRQPDGAEARALLSSLRGAPATRDELARRLGRRAQDLAPALLELELDGFASEDRDGRWRERARL